MLVLSRFAAACFVVALPLFLVTSNVRMLAGDVRFYRHGLRAHGAEEATGIALPELDRSAQEVVNYFENDADTLRIIVYEDGQEASLFNARETEHMKDVKALMRAVFRANEVSLAVVLVYVAGVFLWSGERSLRDLARLSLLGVGVGFVPVLAVGAFALAGFDSAWRQFHELAFSNDLWKLNPDTDHLIQMFPQPFWEEATVIVAALTLAEATIIVVAATAFLLFSRAPLPAPSPQAGRRAVAPPPLSGSSGR